MGASGHSQGGIGSQSLASRDERVAAVVDMMGGGIAIGVANHSKPTLLLTGTGDFMLNSINIAFRSLKGEVFKADFNGYDSHVRPNKDRKL